MNFSAITDSLLVGTSPGWRDFDMLRGPGRWAGNQYAVHAGSQAPRGDPTLRYVGSGPLTTRCLPIPVRALIEGVHLALEEIKSGGKVYTHCAAGRHRSVAMAASILIAQGLAPDGAMKLIKERRPVADPQAYHIRRRIMLFEQQWNVLQLTAGVHKAGKEYTLVPALKNGPGPKKTAKMESGQEEHLPTIHFCGGVQNNVSVKIGP